MLYAQIENSKVIGISDLHSEEVADHLIPIDSYDLSLLGKVWDGTTFTDPIKTLDEIKNEKLQELEQAYYSSFTVFQSDATGTLKTYPINAEAQDNLRDLQQRLIADPNKDSFWFKTIEDGTLVNHTRVQFLQLMEDAESFKVQQTQHFDELVLDWNAATDEATVQAIQW